MPSNPLFGVKIIKESIAAIASVEGFGNQRSNLGIIILCIILVMKPSISTKSFISHQPSHIQSNVLIVGAE